MPNPKSKHTRHRTGIRRGSNSKLSLTGLSTCSNCGKPKLPHRMCGSCGFYNSRLVIAPKAEKPQKPQER